MTLENPLPGEVPASSKPLQFVTANELMFDQLKGFAEHLLSAAKSVCVLLAQVPALERADQAVSIPAINACFAAKVEITNAVEALKGLGISPASDAMPSPAPGSADMLAALKACRDSLAGWVEIADDGDQRKRDWDALDMADAAIAAAEGRPAPQPLERPAFVDDDEGETLYLNHYRCDHEGRAAEGQEPAEWSDEWDCMCNDKCPVCNAEVEPHESEEVNDECE